MCGRVSEVVCVLRIAVKELACDRVLCTGVCEVCAGAECCEQQVRKECVCVCVCVCVYTLGGDSGVLSQIVANFQGAWVPSSLCSSLFCLLLSTHSTCSITMC